MKRIVENIGQLTPELLAELRVRYQPRGSGPLHTMRKIVQLCEAIADEKGWDLDSVEWEFRTISHETIQVVETTKYKGMEPVAGSLQKQPWVDSKRKKKS